MGVGWGFVSLPALACVSERRRCAARGAGLAAEVAARFAGFPRSLRKPLIRVVRDHAGASSCARRAQRSQTGTPRRTAPPLADARPGQLTASSPQRTCPWWVGSRSNSDVRIRVCPSTPPVCNLELGAGMLGESAAVWRPTARDRKTNHSRPASCLTAITPPIDRGRAPSSSMALCVPVCAWRAAARAARAYAPLRGRWARRVDEEAPACSRSTPISGFRRERGNPAQRGATSALAKGHTRARPVPQRATHTPARTAPSAPNHRTQP